MTFQAPAAVFQPLFQAPDPQRAAQPATRPAPVQPPVPPAGARARRGGGRDRRGAPRTTTDGDDDAGGRRRRRRRGGRGRGKARDRRRGRRDRGRAGRRRTGRRPSRTTTPRAAARAGAAAGAAGAGRGGRRPRTTRRTPWCASARRAPGAAPRSDEVQSVRGSTRLEAKKQRRREGRELGRRRPPIITESEFLARRESVERMMVVRQHGDRTQIAVLEDGVLVEHYVNREASQSVRRQRLPRQGAERAAEHGGRVRRHRQGPQRGPVRRRGQLRRRRAGGPAQRDRAGAEVRPVGAGAGHQGPDRAQGRPADQPDQPARPLPGLRARRLDDRHQPQAARQGAHAGSRASSRRSCRRTPA